MKITNVNAVTKVSASLHKIAFKCKKNAPIILFVGGCVAVVGSVAGIIYATLHVEDVQKKHNENIERIKQNDIINIIDSDGSIIENHNIEIVKEHFSYAKDIAKLYGPWILLLVAGIAAQSMGFHKINSRALATAALLSTTTTGYNNYREYIKENYGDEVDKKALAYGKIKETNEIDTENNTIIKTETAEPDSVYRIFGPWRDDDNTMLNHTWSKTDMDTNLRLIDIVNLNCNTLFSNKGYDELLMEKLEDEFGLKRTKEGLVNGWIRHNDCSHVTFVELVREIYQTGPNGEKEKALLIKFNPECNVYNALPSKIA